MIIDQNPDFPLAVDNPTACFRLVTVEVATEWMTTANGQNRRIREKWSDALSRAIADDLFLPTNIGIGFDVKGVLTDGQHRLAAIIKSGKPAVMLIVRGLDPAVRGLVDRGLARNLADVAKLGRGLTLTTRASAITRSMIGRGQRRKISIRYHDSEIMRFYLRHQEAIDFASQIVDVPKGSGLGRADVLAGIARAWHTRDHGRLKEYGQVFVTGYVISSNAEDDAAAIAVRNFALGRGRKEQDKLYDVANKGLWAFCERQPLKIIRPPFNEHFPLPGESEPDPPGEPPSSDAQEPS